MRSFCIFIVSLFMLTTVAQAKKPHLVKGVMSLKQSLVSKSVHKTKKEAVLEGCGPIAAAMLLGYWQTERGFKNLLGKGFDGTTHPKKAIGKLYKALKTKSAPGKKNRAAFTLPDDFFRGLKALVAGRKLEAKRMRQIKSFKKKSAELKKQLRAGNPVVVLKLRQHKDGCIGDDSNGWDIYKNIANSHYFVAVGYKGNRVAVMPGWSESPKSDSMSWKDYYRSKDINARRTCTFEQLKKDGIALFWVEKAATASCKKDKDCGRGKWCDKGTMGIGKNICKSKYKKGKKCSRKGQCKSNKCSLFKCK